MIGSNIRIATIDEETSSKICFVNLKEEDKDYIFNLIDDHIKNICYAGLLTKYPEDYSIKTACNAIKKALSLDKSKYKGVKEISKKNRGTIAEFFVHVLLNKYNYQPHSSLTNLESEGEIKKGFDGLYKKDDKIWLMESKSSIPTLLSNPSHDLNIKEAYVDLKDKLSGKKRNNPWLNAFHHSTSYSLDDDLIGALHKLSIKHRDKNYSYIDNHNIIPASTIFATKAFKNENQEGLVFKSIKTYLESNDNYRSVKCICISNYMCDLFIDYLNERSDNEKRK